MYRMGVEATQMEVRFEKLTVEAETQVGRQADLPTLINATLNGVEVHIYIYIVPDFMFCFFFFTNLFVPFFFRQSNLFKMTYSKIT